MDAIYYIIIGFVPGTLATAVFFISRHSQALETARDEQSRLMQELQSARENNIRHEMEKSHLDRQIHQHNENLTTVEARFKEQFENLAGRIFDEKSKAFKSQSEQGLHQILNPLHEKIKDFQKKVDDSFGKQMNEQYSLKNEIKNIVDANQKITLQAENLANALKGESKVQGDWGEIILERILEDAGLQHGRDYVLQGTDLGLRHVESGKVQKPDVIINLPEGKHIVIDSKTSLTHYERFCSEPDEALRVSHLKDFTHAVRARVKELEETRYQDNDKLKASEIILMFMPIEGAYALAMQKDRELHQFAWGKKIVIVCPSTLFATLRTIASLRRLELQNQNAQEIARQGGDLYDKISGLVTDMLDLGKQIRKTDEFYEKAMNKLKSGKGNIISRTEKMRELGMKTSKTLPIEIIEDSNFYNAPDTSDLIVDMLEEKKRA